MNESRKLPIEFEPGSPEDIADKLVTKWEADVVIDTEDDLKGEKKSLGIIISDFLKEERAKRNEKEMLPLIEALKEKVTPLTSSSDENIRDESSSALAVLNDSFENYKSIEKI
jgi:hypothetical protein